MPPANVTMTGAMARKTGDVEDESPETMRYVTTVSATLTTIDIGGESTTVVLNTASAIK